MTIQMIPLSQLYLSDLNVRKTEKAVDIESLAADILHRGVKQNLVVIESPFREVDEQRFDVIAGGRRLQALMLLADNGAIEKDYSVPCLVDPSLDATETSLSENLHKVAMNPADEFLAFREIITGYGDIDPAEAIAQCAKRFGVTVDHVRGRMRLANLASVVIDALKANEITFTSAMAYACVDDADKQAKVFAAQAKSSYKPHEADAVRRAMKDKTIDDSDPRVRFIGLEMYVERGGRIETDFFTLGHPQILVDTKLVDDLVREVFDKKKKRLISKIGFDDARLGSSHYNAPKVAGYDQKWCSGEPEVKIEEARNAGLKTIGLFYLNSDGKLERSSYMLVELPPKDESEKEAPARQAYREPTPEERAAERRENHIRLEAMRLAFPACAGTPFEGRIFLPPVLTWVREEDRELETGEEVSLIEAKLLFTKAEIAQHLEAAAVIVDEALAAKARAEEEVKAQREAARAAEVKLVEDMLAGDPPAVVEISDRYSPIVFRHESGEYFDVRDGSDDEGVRGYESLEDLADQEIIVAHWPTIEAWEAEHPEETSETSASTEPSPADEFEQA